MIKINIKRKNFENLLVLEDINLEIEKSEFFCILGPSGCGKSTLLRCIGGFEEFEGEVYLDGEKVQKPRKDSIMVFQDFQQLFPWLSVLDNVLFAMKHINGERKDNHKEALDFLKLVGLKDFANYYPHQLSGGMKQRVAIARSLATKPKVLLMDEPFGSLDAQTRAILQRELLKLWKQFKTTIVFVTHNIQESIILGDRIMVMSQNPGKIKLLAKNDLPRPRRPDKEGFAEFWHYLYSNLGRKKLEEEIASNV
ncbi:MAG: ABC transporter ATP-binding protein [Candidatus Heimdallarchaeaceae archaeon]